jgi:2-haloacid dehalogenase
MASTQADIYAAPPKALCFDVFGTVVDWRRTVTKTLISSAQAKTSSSSTSASLTPQARQRLSELTDTSWGEFAQEWRNTYKAFVSGYKPDEDEWRDIDTHHRLSLIELLRKWRLEGVYNDDEIEDLSKVWHFLDPWIDSAHGIEALGRKFITSTLSNGNQSLLKDLNKHGNLGFRLLQSSEDFKAYKPHPSTYLGAAKRMDLDPKDCAMVAAHLNDLRVARSLGYKTIYVERPLEEDWKPEQDEYHDAKTWVDLWVSQDERGFLEVARRFGIDISDGYE